LAAFRLLPAARFWAVTQASLKRSQTLTMFSFLHLTNFEPEIIAPSVKRVSPGVMEIRRYQDGRMRTIFWPLVVVLWIGAICSGQLSTGGAISWALFPQHNINAQYNYHEWEGAQIDARKELSYEAFTEKEYENHLRYRGKLARTDEEEEAQERLVWSITMQEVLRKRYEVEKPAIRYEEFVEKSYQEFLPHRQKRERNSAEEEENYRRIWYMVENKELQHRYEVDRQERARLRQMPVTYEAFIQEKKEENRAKRSRGWFGFYILAALLILATYPKGRPVRIDINRRLVYFYGWGRFYIYRYPVYSGLGQYPNPLEGFRRFVEDFQLHKKEHYASTKHGGNIHEEWLAITIPCENPQKKPCTVAIGAYMFQMSDPLASFLFHYVNRQFTDEALVAYLNEGRKRLWFSVEKKPLRTLFKYIHLLSEISPLPGWGYRGSGTERKIQQWLQTQGGGANLS